MCITPRRYQIEISAPNYKTEERVVHINEADYVSIINLTKILPSLENVGSPKQYSGELLSLNFHEIEIRAALQLISDFAGRNIVISDTVRGNLTVRLKEVPYDEAMDVIITLNGLEITDTGNIVMVYDR